MQTQLLALKTKLIFGTVNSVISIWIMINRIFQVTRVKATDTLAILTL
jgi:hypothetical protein